MLEIRTQEFGFKKGHNLGGVSPNWKGENAGYSALHKWIRNHKPIPRRCERCGKVKKLQASNHSGEYKRDISDWEYICARCHVYKDETVKNLRRDTMLGKKHSLSTRKKMKVAHLLRWSKIRNENTNKKRGETKGRKAGGN